MTVIISQTAGSACASKATKTIAGPFALFSCLNSIVLLPIVKGGNFKLLFQVAAKYILTVYSGSSVNFLCPQKKPHTSGFPF